MCVRVCVCTHVGQCRFVGLMVGQLPSSLDVIFGSDEGSRRGSDLTAGSFYFLTLVTFLPLTRDLVTV